MIRDPVIVLGPPRSGTTMLFETLARSSALWSLADESHAILEGPYHPGRRGWESNALGAGDLDAATARELRRIFARRVQPGRLRRAKQDRQDARRSGRPPSPGGLSYLAIRARAAMERRFRVNPIRILEKTPKNCLRIPFLRALFPDARFVVVRRDARATISSMMDAWHAGGRYETYELPEPLAIPDRPGQGWCFVLPPGWRALTRLPLEEVCAAQWLACAETLLAAMPALGADGVLLQVAYEDLVERPVETLATLTRFLDIPNLADLLPADGHLRTVNAVTPPGAGKWRTQNRAAIERILPRIATAQRAFGYHLG